MVDGRYLEGRRGLERAITGYAKPFEGLEILLCSCEPCVL